MENSEISNSDCNGCCVFISALLMVYLIFSVSLDNYNIFSWNWQNWFMYIFASLIFAGKGLKE